MKWAQAEAMGDGYLPLVDPYRSGGQPALGNPNSVGLYPDNVLFLIAPVIWALNAHFWLHLLLAPLSGYWLGRAWGLRRDGAWAVAVTFATCGYFLPLSTSTTWWRASLLRRRSRRLGSTWRLAALADGASPRWPCFGRC